MKSISAALAAAVFVSIACCALASARTDDQQAEQAIKLATDAAQLVHKEGLAAACREMEAPGSQFNQGDTYAFIMDMKGVWRCFPPKPAAEGQSAYEIVDPDGKKMLPEQIEIAKSPAGQGWVEYRWNNPATGKIQPKRSFVKAVPGGELFAVSGYYY